jgi:hypothetical protein
MAARTALMIFGTTTAMIVAYLVIPTVFGPLIWASIFVVLALLIVPHQGKTENRRHRAGGIGFDGPMELSFDIPSRRALSAGSRRPRRASPR